MLAFLVIIAIIVVVAIYFVVVWVRRTYRRQVATGREELIGKTATVQTPLKPKGMVLVAGERWTAIIDEGQADPEEEVIITRVEGLKLHVTKKR
ncbi:MAG: serine protease [Dehalococcoidales bacterium]|nr:serine protease [Dehalococcoidales bacterium]